MNAQITTVNIQRGWGDYRIAAVPLSALWGWHMSDTAGGTGATLPREALTAYVQCTDLGDQEFGHSCVHGPAPHTIKVIVAKKHNRELYAELRALVGAHA